MRVMVIVKATTDSEAGKLPSRELMAAMGAFNQKLIAAGVMVDGGGLKPTAEGARVAFDGAHRTVKLGPFGIVGELASGYWIWKVRGPRRGDRLGQAMPQSDARPVGDRDPPALRDGRLRLNGGKFAERRPCGL